MKSKKSLYILIPVVALVWGLIIYRVIDMTSSKPIMPDWNAAQINSNDTLMYPKQKKLLLNYRDPFLRRLPTNSIAENNSGVVSLFNTNPEPEKEIVSWPEIIYKGLVKNKRKSLAILKIDKKKMIVSMNQQINDLKVARIYNDSIIIVKEKEKKTFYK